MERPFSTLLREANSSPFMGSLFEYRLELDYLFKFINDRKVVSLLEASKKFGDLKAVDPSEILSSDVLLKSPFRSSAAPPTPQSQSPTAAPQYRPRDPAPTVDEWISGKVHTTGDKALDDDFRRRGFEIIP
jgi:hypothetical protein